MEAVVSRLYRRCVRAAAGAAGPAPDDASLLGRFARERDPSAFEALLARHGPMVLGVCRRVLRHAPDADDAFQATFLVLIRRAATLRDPARLGPWLYGVACRTALKARARAARRRFGPLPPEGPSAPEAARHEGDLRPALDEAVRALPAKYREPVVLCYLQGLTNAQAAERLGCPPGTVATRLARARERLRAWLACRGHAATAGLLGASLAEASAPTVLPIRLHAAAAQLALDGTVPATISALANESFGRLLMTKWNGAAVLALVGTIGLGVCIGTGPAGAREVPAATKAPTETEIPAPSVAVTDAPTPNFRVEAPTARLAAYIARAAERHRKEVALAWLGKELPDWPEPCPVRITLAEVRTVGTTTFSFGGGRVTGQSMILEGPLERVLACSLPHEVTHTVLAHHFGKPLPRWADEGVALMSEDAQERARHLQLARDVFNEGRAVRLRKLLGMTDYPRDVMALYGEGYALTAYLVGRRDRATFLAFVADGMAGDWDAAARKHYGLDGVDGLEQAWLESLRVAAKPQAASDADADPDVIELNARDFDLRFQVNPARRDEIVEVRLFASSDRGKTWRQVATATPDPDRGSFHFSAPSDGLYWFNIQSVLRDGKAEPAELSGRRPVNRVLIRTGDAKALEPPVVVPPASTSPPLAAGPAPLTGLARMDEAGKLTVRVPAAEYEPATSYRRREGPGGQVTYEPVTAYRLRKTERGTVYSAGDVRAFDARGKQVAAAALRERLRTETPVLVSQNGRMVDAFYLQLVKPDAIVVVPTALPAIAVPAVRPTVEIPPLRVGD